MNIDDIKNLLDNLDKKNLNEKIRRNIYALRVIKASTTREVQARPRKAKRHNTKDPKVVEAYMQLDK